MTYQLLCFDLDGTLLDPTLGITNSVRYALATFGLAEPAAKLRHFIGPPLLESFQQSYQLDEAQAWQAVNAYRDYFGRQGMYESTVFPGIPALLAELQARGRQLAVVTSKPQVYAEPILAHFGLAPYFTYVCGPALDMHDAAKAVLLQRTLDHFPAIPQSAVVMVGDRQHDILGAQAHNLASIGVTYGAGTAEEISAAAPTKQADSVAELSALLLADEPR